MTHVAAFDTRVTHYMGIMMTHLFLQCTAVIIATAVKKQFTAVIIATAVKKQFTAVIIATVVKKMVYCSNNSHCSKKTNQFTAVIIATAVKKQFTAIKRSYCSEMNELSS